jgi:hypothetical protein
VYVAKDGDDESGDGSMEHPWATIGYAMERAGRAATETDPVRIHVGEGTFAEKVALLANVFVEGAGVDATVIEHFGDDDALHYVVTAADHTAIRDCTITLPGVYGAVATLLHLQDVSMEVSNVALDGAYNQYCTGVLVSGIGSSGSVIQDSVVAHLQDGVWAVDSGVNITRNQFDQIWRHAIFVLPPSGKESSETPLLGDAAEPYSTGFNQFREVYGSFVMNMNPAETLAEYNDWGVYMREAIQAGISGTGPVDFDPWIGKALVPGSIAVEVVDAATGEYIPLDLNPLVTLNTASTAIDAASNLYIFTPLEPGTYEIEAAADGYRPATQWVVLTGSGILAVVVELEAVEGEGEGEGEGQGPACLGLLGGTSTPPGPRSLGQGAGDLAVFGAAIMAMLAAAARKRRTSMI